MKNNLQLINNEVTMTSKELCDLINEFRKLEGNDTLKRHDDLMKSIRKELEDLANAGIEGDGNFSESYYINSQNKKQPCYNMNKSGAMQILSKESAVVRFKIQQYIEQLEQTLMANALPVPQGPQLIGSNPYRNYLIRKNINQLDTADIPRYVNQILKQAKDYKPSERLNTYQLTRTALENLLPTLIESYDITIVRASLDKLNKLIEKQKTYISASKLGQATKKNNKLEETIRYYQLDSYDNYYYVDIHGYTVNTAYRAINNEIKCTKSYVDWKNRAEEKMKGLPSLKELGLNPNTYKKLDIYFYLKDPSFDVANCQKSFLDALEKHYKKECPTFNDNVFADVRVRKYFSYADDYDMGFIAFGIKDLTQDEIDDLTFDDEE